MARKKAPKKIESIRHAEDSRKNIPTAEFRAVMADDERTPIEVAYQRRNRDLDPQLVWRGKDEQDQGDLIAQATPLYIQEKVHPKALIDDLVQHAKDSAPPDESINLFADLNGLPPEAGSTDFYEHDSNWSNRMILGDSLHVMASLAEREDLRGKVQCVYFDPPYGIKFNSNFQWSTTSRVVQDGNRKHITREPEQVKAFRDTWRDGVHSYLTYLRDRLTAARELLSESGSIFVQIGDENVHRVRALMDEVFGEDNFVAHIPVKKTSAPTDKFIPSVFDTTLWYAKCRDETKYRQLWVSKGVGEVGGSQYTWLQDAVGVERKFTKAERERPSSVPAEKVFAASDVSSSHEYSLGRVPVSFRGTTFTPRNRYWSTSPEGMTRLRRTDRLVAPGNTLFYKRYLRDFPVMALTNLWTDTSSSFGERVYVVQTNAKVVQRCVLMTTDPGDLVLDPTCGSGTTAYVAEQWGRRWITIDTSRVALALARARIMGARYPYYLLADSPEGQRKEAEMTRKAPSDQPTYGRIRQGFVYKRVPHITLRQIANNAEIDVIWGQHQQTLEPLRMALNGLLETDWEEWQIPREPDESWPPKVRELHGRWWEARIARQEEMDASISAMAPFEYLYDKPYEDRKVVRVAGPFTVESLSPHRMLPVGLNEDLIGLEAPSGTAAGLQQDFAGTILDQLRTAGVQQAHRDDRIDFTAVTGWPGDHVCAVGQYVERNRVRRAGILIGPEFGTVSRPDLAAAAREAAEAGFDALVACAFNYDAQSADFAKLGRVPIIKARMNADLHMADELKNTGKGNLFVVFGEPDIKIHDADDGKIRVEIRGVDVFHPSTGEIRSDDTKGIACWFIDTDYNEESFFVRQAYFLGANDPYKALKTTLKAEIDRHAWATLRSNTSRPFSKPKSGRIAIKVINHLGDEAMRVFSV
ncbi:MAG: site-specific DNA-methyltransferase [Gemmatimonadetes bacterium]|nr:site-specific DNA-methyltransferase [Gemmatimonadota bacterium]MYG35500.1 site-specific DNA-methyltransferase [Gemmatimonadota bacterium]